MEIDLAFKTWIDNSEEMIRQNNVLLARSRKPIHRPVVGSVTQGAGVGNAVALLTNDSVDSGRVWNVLKIGVFGNDGHTVLGTTPAVSQPAVPASTVAQQNTNQFPVQVVLSGFTATAVFVNGVQVGTTNGTYTVPANGSISVTYTVQGTWTWTALTTTPAIADIYAAAGNPEVPDFSAQLVTGTGIPSVIFIPEKMEWMHYGESIVALLYGVPANSSITLIARIADYPVEAVESMDIR